MELVTSEEIWTCVALNYFTIFQHHSLYILLTLPNILKMSLGVIYLQRNNRETNQGIIELSKDYNYATVLCSSF